MSLKVIIIFVSLIVVGIFNNPPALALNPTECTSEKYLINHGHSQEIIRMINLQKERTEGKLTEASKSQNKIKKFFKNIWFEQDVTLPVNDFGYNVINTVETNKSSIPPTLEAIKAKYKQNQNKDSAEIYINDVKVRDAK